MASVGRSARAFKVGILQYYRYSCTCLYSCGTYYLHAKSKGQIQGPRAGKGESIDLFCNIVDTLRLRAVLIANAVQNHIDRFSPP